MKIALKTKITCMSILLVIVIAMLIYPGHGISSQFSSDEIQSKVLGIFFKSKNLRDFRSVAHQYEIDIPLDILRDYYSLIGPDMMLSVLDENKNCHYQGHNLGKVIMEMTGNVIESIQICKSRCHNGCLHGIFYGIVNATQEHLHNDGSIHLHPSDTDIELLLSDLCEDDKIYQFINNKNTCYHGTGHGFAILSLYDVNQSIEYCNNLLPKGKNAVFHCASGAYMELFNGAMRNDKEPENICTNANDHLAACYRHMLHEYLSLNLNGTELLEFCNGLEGMHQIGCMSALGNTVPFRYGYKSGDIKAYCENTNAMLAKLCMEGFLEKIHLDYQRHKKLRPEGECNYFEGGLKEICVNALSFNSYDQTTANYSNYYYLSNET